MELQEGELIFSFDDTHWSDLINFDQGNVDYSKIEKLNGTKAVDFLGSHSQFGYCFIEVKNFRYHRIENRKRIDSGDLFLEVGQKVRDATACLVGGSRNSTHLKGYWQRVLSHISNQDQALTVVLWLEENPNIFFGRNEVQEKRKKFTRNVKTNALKAQLGWLTSRVFILSSRDSNLNQWDLQVSFNTSLAH